MMNNLILLIFTTTISGSILFMLLLLIDYFFNQHIRTIYFISKLLLLFYMIPGIGLSLFIIGLNTKQIALSIQTEDFNYAVVSSGNNISSLKNGNAFLITTLIIWMIGILLLYVLRLIRDICTLHRLRCNSTRIECGNILLACNKIKKQLKVNKEVKLYQSNLISTPFITGIFRPIIFVPEYDFSAKEWDLILTHELIHLKNNDILFKMLLTFIQKLHWFNPIIYFYTKKFYEFCECTCDRNVSAVINKEQRAVYAHLIVKLARDIPASTISVNAFSDKNYKLIKRRICCIMKKSKKINAAFIITLALFTILSPAVTYGAVNKIVSAQNHLVAQFASAALNEINNNASSLLKVQGESNNTSTNIGTLSVRGSNQVDFMVPGQGSVKFNSVSLQSGSSIRVLIGADNTSDKFEVRVLDSNGNGSKLISDSGSVNGTIDIDTAGNYTISIVGKNSSSTKFHVTGTIIINY